jgi:hypothetical protein
MAKTPPVPPPTAAQQRWLSVNKAFQRMHAGRRSGKVFSNRGTLRPDGTFIREAPRFPVMDGNGMFGVGVPVEVRRR